MQRRSGMALHDGSSTDLGSNTARLQDAGFGRMGQYGVKAQDVGLI